MIKNAEKPEVSDRVEKEKRELLSSPPRLDLDNVKILLDVYNETKGQPPVMRRARYFAGLCAEKRILY